METPLKTGVQWQADVLMEVPASTSVLTSGVTAQITRTMTTGARDVRISPSNKLIIN